MLLLLLLPVCQHPTVPRKLPSFRGRGRTDSTHTQHTTTHSHTDLSLARLFVDCSASGTLSAVASTFSCLVAAATRTAPTKHTSLSPSRTFLRGQFGCGLSHARCTVPVRVTHFILSQLHCTQPSLTFLLLLFHGFSTFRQRFCGPKREWENKNRVQWRPK